MSCEILTSCSLKKDFHLQQLPLACSKGVLDLHLLLDPLEPLIGFLDELWAEFLDKLLIEHLTKPLSALLAILFANLLASVD